MILIADSDPTVSLLKSQAFCMACLIYRKRRNRSPSSDQKRLILYRLSRLILDDERHVKAAAEFALKGLFKRKANIKAISHRKIAA
jgi:hypothetical protein